MNRVILVLSLALFTGACQDRQSDPEPVEIAGPLEGNWKVRNVEPVMYDRQDKVVATYKPIDAIGYSQLTITATELQHYDGVTNGQYTDVYVRQGDLLICTPPARSYTIRKLTDKVLDLYLRGEYYPYGNQDTRTDFTIHLDRQ
ncbi:hypothetical protein GCM10027346_42590 [Hymenobacter seoulensis]